MNTRFHVPSKVFGTRRNRGRRSEGDGGGLSTSGAPPARFIEGDPGMIDPMLDDRAGRSGAYLIEGERTVLVDPGSAVAAPRVVEALKARKVRVDLILLTHLHPHVAAGAGAVAENFPKATVAAPAGTASRLAEPAAQISDMRSAYGERSESEYGQPVGIDRSRIRHLSDGDRIDLGDRALEAISTPGHTSAHLSYLDHRTSSLFCGDALGVQLPASSVVRPSAPPWDFSLGESLDSIERLQAVEPETVYLTHFGAARPGPGEIFERAADSLERWHRSYLRKREQAESDEDLSRQFNACLEASLEPVAPTVRRDLEAVSPAWLNLAGFDAEQDRLGGRLSDAA